MPKGTPNEQDTAITDEDVIAEVKRLVADGWSVRRDEWNQVKPAGYPSVTQLRLRTGQTWGEFMQAHGIKSKYGPRPGRGRFIRDRKYYRKRMRALCPDGAGLRRDEWDAVRDADKGELSAASVGDLFGGWPAFLTECGLSYPAHGNKDRAMEKREEDEAAIFRELVGDVSTEDRRRVKPLVLVASEKISGTRRLYCPVRHTWYTVKVRAAGRFV